MGRGNGFSKERKKNTPTRFHFPSQSFARLDTRLDTTRYTRQEQQRMVNDFFFFLSCNGFTTLRWTRAFFLSATLALDENEDLLLVNGFCFSTFCRNNYFNVTVLHSVCDPLFVLVLWKELVIFTSDVCI